MKAFYQRVSREGLKPVGLGIHAVEHMVSRFTQLEKGAITDTMAVVHESNIQVRDPRDRIQLGTLSTMVTAGIHPTERTKKKIEAKVILKDGSILDCKNIRRIIMKVETDY